MNPSDADFRLLDTARKTDYYGVVLHSAQDHEGEIFFITVEHVLFHFLDLQIIDVNTSGGTYSSYKYITVDY